VRAKAARISPIKSVINSTSTCVMWKVNLQAEIRKIFSRNENIPSSLVHCEVPDGYIFADEFRDHQCNHIQVDPSKWYRFQEHFDYNCGHGCIYLHPVDSSVFFEQKDDEIKKLRCNNMSLAIHNVVNGLELSEESIKVLSKNHPFLIQLSIQGSKSQGEENRCNVWKLIAQLENLISLNIQWSDKLPYDDVSRLWVQASKLRNIRKLVIIGSIKEFQVDENLIAESIRLNPDLEFVGISMCSKMEAGPIIDALLTLPNLFSLQLQPWSTNRMSKDTPLIDSFRQLVGKASISNLIVSFDRENVLFPFSSCWQIVWEEMLAKNHYVSMHLNGISAFQLSPSQSNSPKTGVNLSSLKMDIVREVTQTDKDLVHFFSEISNFCSSLVSLTLWNVESVDIPKLQVVISDFLQASPKLEELHLKSTRLVGSNVIKQLCKMKDLRILNLFSCGTDGTFWKTLFELLATTKLRVSQLEIFAFKGQSFEETKTFFWKLFNSNDLNNNFVCHSFTFPGSSESENSSTLTLQNWTSRNAHYYQTWMRILLCYILKRSGVQTRSIFDPELYWMILTFIGFCHRCKCPETVIFSCPELNNIWNH
jgi:hypothetical protein